MALVASECNPMQAEEEWIHLTEQDRRSSRALARYLYNRFHDKSGDGTGPGVWRWTLEPDFRGGLEAHLDLEASCEHRRWTAFMLVENHSPTGSAIPSGYEKRRADGIRYRNIGRANKHLVPYADLDEGEKLRNVLMVAGHEWVKRGASLPVPALGPSD